MKEQLLALGDKIREYEKPETIPGRLRSRLINISNCRNIVVSGLTLKNGASWNVHMVYSDHIVTDHCTFSRRMCGTATGGIGFFRKLHDICLCVSYRR